MNTKDALNEVEQAIAAMGGPQPEYIKDGNCGDRLDLEVCDGSTVTIEVDADRDSPVDARPDQDIFLILHIIWGPLANGGEAIAVRSVAVGPRTAAGAALALLAELDEAAE